MLVKDLADHNIKPLSASCSVEEAMGAMESSSQPLLPLVDPKTNRFAGMVSRNTLEQHRDSDIRIYELREEHPAVALSNQNIFDTARQMEKSGVSVIPIIEPDNQYLGMVDMNRLFDRIVRVFNLTEYGSVLTVHFKERDFTLSKLVHIIESEGGLIMGLGVDSPRDNQPFYIVTIKINLSDPSRIVSSLKRHSYIVDAHSVDGQDTRHYEDRADELMHYLNI
ncbi:CBS domain-containing protein [Balneolaceae bacterium ANBcel3]|nr:CBS domain-containing protein [Balneolaceae bacterium ANBcel3]